MDGGNNIVGTGRFLPESCLLVAGAASLFPSPIPKPSSPNQLSLNPERTMGFESLPS